MKKKLDYTPSHNSIGEYVILMETSGEAEESWYYFIKLDGNEANLQHLNKQLESVKWYILEHLSFFCLDMEQTVSASTAKEMTKVHLNGKYHKKFDGKLQKINLDFKKKDGNDTKICKTFDVLGHGKIKNFINDQDVDDDYSSDSSSDSNSSSSSEEEEETDTESLSSNEVDLDIPEEIINKLKKKLITT